MIIKFTQTQTEQGCRYPIGCPVWIFAHDTLYDDITEARTFQRGTVSSVAMDFRSKQMTYEVTTGDKICSVSERQLGFGSGCSVHVASEEDTEHGHCDSLLEGTVLLCKKTAQETVYTVQFMGWYEENIGEGRITYRKVLQEAVVDDSKGSPLEQPKSLYYKCDEQTVKMDTARETTRSEQANTQGQKSGRPLSESAVPPSITCDGSRVEARLSDTTSSLPTVARAEKIRDDTTQVELYMASAGETSRDVTDVSTTSSKRQTVDFHGVRNDRVQEYITHSLSTPRIESAGIQNHHLQISVPMWLQKDHRSQRILFFHLVGDRNNPGGTNSRQIEHETNCLMRVNWDDSAEQDGFPPKPMMIDLRPCDKASDRQTGDLLMARRKVEDIILEHSISPFPTIKDDGSKGRLMYHIAANCAGAHRPKDSTSRAVRQRNLFEGSICWMSLLELPCTISKVGKIFHGNFLMDSKVIEKVKNRSGCNFKLIGNDFGVPTVYCDPYVLVVGYHWAKVDQAIQILKEETWRHRNGWKHPSSC